MRPWELPLRLNLDSATGPDIGDHLQNFSAAAFVDLLCQTLQLFHVDVFVVVLHYVDEIACVNELLLFGSSWRNHRREFTDQSEFEARHTMRPHSSHGVPKRQSE